MDDLISRQDVLNAPLKLTYDGMEWIPTYHIEELPSAEPEIIYCQECIKADLCAWRREGAKYCSYAGRRTDE